MPRRARLVCLLAFFACFVPVLCRAEETPATAAAFLKLIDRPRVDPAVEVDDPTDIGDDLKQRHFTFLSEENVRVPGIVIYPANAVAQLPCVIVLHGTGGSKENEIPIMKQLAARGCAAAAIDGRFHGERLKGLAGSDHYNQAILKRFKGEIKTYPLYWDTVWDLMRLIDIVSARQDIDAQRIGMLGFSKGGIETYFTAAVDPRIACAVPCIGVQSFRWGLENEGWYGRVSTFRNAFEAAGRDVYAAKLDAAFAKIFFDKVVPGIDGPFDGDAMLPLIAPRPLLIINGDSDANTPLAGVNRVAAKTRAAYEKAKAADRFVQIVEPHTGHKVSDESLKQAIDFLGTWLKF